jgi:hypothetical protein
MAWMMGMFFSPEALFLHGKMAGLSGYGFVLPLGVGLVLHWMNGTGAGQDEFAITAPDAEIRLLKETWGPLAAAFLLLMARPVVAVCLATAVLVTSGFVFNEVFFYWFPNFGFAALVLGGLLIVNVIGPQVAAALQLMLASIAIIGIAGISIVGLLAWSQAPHAPQQAAFVANGQSAGRYPLHAARNKVLRIIVIAAMITGTAVLVVTDDAPAILLKTMSTILALATFLAMVGLRFAKGLIVKPNMMPAKIKKGETP